MLGDFAFQELGRQEGRLCDMSRSIWENPEGPYREYHASRLCADFLEENGFAVEIGCCGIPTAVRAVYGKGSPVIGFLGNMTPCRDRARTMWTTKSLLKDRHLDMDVAITFWRYPWQAVPWQQKRKWKSRE